MKNTLKQTFFTLLSCIILILLLFQSKQCIKFASNGLLLWYHNMIPSLFPFMVLSGFLIKSGLSNRIGKSLQPILGSIFQLPPQMLYAIFMGFLCGFPMGAKMVADLLENKQITKKQGEFLLAFCNNIGPLYMLGYIIPLFDYHNVWSVLVLMYFPPLIYGLILRYACPYYSFDLRTKASSKNTSITPSHKSRYTKKSLTICSKSTKISDNINYITCFQNALISSIEQITLLGGCMVFFNCMLIFPQLLETYIIKYYTIHDIMFVTSILKSFIEIGGGLQQLNIIMTQIQLKNITLFLPLSLLTLGGLSCIAQTCFILKNTGLKISTYIKHKLIQSCIYIIMIFITYIIS